MAYILQTATSLAALAKERRFQRHKATVLQSTTDELPTDSQLRARWQDVPTAWQKEKYENLTSYWDAGNIEHCRRFSQLLEKWIIIGKLGQSEVETRLQFCNIQGEQESKQACLSGTEQAVSYLGAITQGKRTATEEQNIQERERMLELCTRPVVRLTELRTRTKEEDRDRKSVV